MKGETMTLEDNEAVYVTTGAVVPDGTRAVVPVEQTRKIKDGTCMLNLFFSPRTKLTHKTLASYRNYRGGETQSVDSISRFRFE